MSLQSKNFNVNDQVRISGTKTSLDGQQGAILGRASENIIDMYIIFLYEPAENGQKAVVLPEGCLELDEDNTVTKIVKGLEDNQPDWTVFYRNNEEKNIQAMSIFGVATIEDAIREAHYSLSIVDKDWYLIIKVEQDNVDWSSLDDNSDIVEAMSDIGADTDAEWLKSP